jgi:hypothetical protein
MSKFEELLNSEFEKLEEAGFTLRGGDGQANVTGQSTQPSNPTNQPTSNDPNQQQPPSQGEQDVMQSQSDPQQLARDVSNAFSGTDQRAISDFVKKLNIELKGNPNTPANRVSELSQFDADGNQQQAAGATNYNV